MKRTSALWLLATSLCILSFRWADEDPIIQKILEKLQAFTTAYPQEKVYLHTDKPYYSLGDTIWIKGYLFGAGGHQPDSVSRVLYVDLLHEQSGKLLIHKALHSTDGMANGEIALGDTLVAGTYQLRAYTAWMRNRPEAFFFSKELLCFDTKKPIAFDESKVKQLNEVADFQLFPEGGSLVEGLNSRVGFKALNTLGNGVEAEGFVLSSQKDTVASFSSQHLGMGFFSLIPADGTTYAAHVKQANGTYKTYALPTAQTKGYLMTVDNLSNKDNIKVFLAHTVKDKGTLYLLAQQRGMVCHASKAPADRERLTFLIPRSQIPDDGVVQLTLFDTKGRPQCERVVFEQKNRQLNISISANKKSYKPHEKVSLTIKATDAEGKPVAGNFSLAVTDAQQVVSTGLEDNLLTNLLLCSDVQPLGDREAYFQQIRGRIEDPAYYFDAQNTSAKSHLDLLLLTQGWRRFTWAEVLSDEPKKEPEFLIEPGLAITGKVSRFNGKSLDKAIQMTLFSKQLAEGMVLLESNPNGKFGFYGLDFSDSTELFVQAMKENGGKNLKIDIDDWQTPKVRLWKTAIDPIAFNKRDLTAFLNKAKEMQEIERRVRLSQAQLLQEVNIKAKKLEAPDSRRAMYGKGGRTANFGPADCAGKIHVLEMLMGKFPGVQVTPNGLSGYSVNIRASSNMAGKVDPLFLIDGVPVEKEALMGVSPCNVESVDILNASMAAKFGSRAYGGVIAILTKTDNDPKQTLAEGVVVAKRVGYASPREFYSPVYDPAPSFIRPDYRSTLYWNPNISTNIEGTATVTFYTSDEKTTLKAQIEGHNHRGNVGVGRGEWKVN